jgi:hypothetical protein
LRAPLCWKPPGDVSILTVSFCAVDSCSCTHCIRGLICRSVLD